MTEADSEVKAEKFVTSGICCPETFEECEVALVVELEDKSSGRLYACKHRLSAISKFFHGLFHADFKEKDKIEVEINKVSYASLLLFLQCAAEQQITDLKQLPKDKTLCVLIDLADMFMCQLLKDRIIQHLESKIMFEADVEAKQAVIVTADQHKQNCVEILEAAVRLCATVPFAQIGELRNLIGLGTLTCIFVLSGQAMSHPPMCPTCIEKGKLPGVAWKEIIIESHSNYHCWRHKLSSCNGWWTGNFYYHTDCFDSKKSIIGRPPPILAELKLFTIDRDMLMLP